MTINSAEREDLDSLATATFAHLFQALADPSRLSLLQHLSYGEHRVRDLVDHLGLAQSTVSKHLSYLQECQLVTLRPDGRATWYALARPTMLAHLLTAAQDYLDATGTPAALCPHILNAAAARER